MSRADGIKRINQASFDQSNPIINRVVIGCRMYWLSGPPTEDYPYAGHQFLRIILYEHRY